MFARQASFRGIPFNINSNTGENGRQNAIHNYPLRDQTWVEDLGRSQRRYAIHGFLIGEDCILTRQLMIAAVEQAGPGLLIHPTFGILKVSVIHFTWREPENISWRIDLDFEFIEYSNPLSGLTSEAVGPVIGNLSDNLSDSVMNDFIETTQIPFTMGLDQDAISLASDWGKQAILQGDGPFPIASLSNEGNTQNSLDQLANNREALNQAMTGIDPDFDTYGIVAP